jgi:CheY-like chemotaxis protein
VSGDVLRLAQVFANLLTNAAKYTPSGGRIEVRGWSAGGRVILAVKDNGRGIDATMVDRIFEPFVQGERRHESVSAGLGLGLPLVRSLVLLHEGSVRAVSAGPGLGSEFIVELPACSPVEKGTGPAGAPSGLRARPQRPRLLVVDDNEAAAGMVAEALQPLGYECRVAHDGPSALSAAAEFQPAVAILDIGLPVMDGYELGRRLTDLLADVALVALTGYGEERDRQRSRAAGFAAHLVKPVDLHQLTNTLATLTS